MGEERGVAPVLLINAETMRAISLILVILLGGLLIRCETEEMKSKIEADYFPMAENSQWKYLRKLFSNDDPATLSWSDTTINLLKGDTTIEDLDYKKVVDPHGSLVKVLRKEDGKYYGRNHELYGGFSKEYLFLDDNATLNTTWRHYKNDSTNVTEYTVKSLNSSRTFNNIEYQSVMEIEVNYYYQDGEEYVLNYSTLHYYANGIGEIYAYYPYPSLMFGDLDISLLKFTPHE